MYTEEREQLISKAWRDLSACEPPKKGTAMYREVESLRQEYEKYLRLRSCGWDGSDLNDEKAKEIVARNKTLPDPRGLPPFSEPTITLDTSDPLKHMFDPLLNSLMNSISEPEPKLKKKSKKGKKTVKQENYLGDALIKDITKHIQDNIVLPIDRIEKMVNNCMKKNLPTRISIKKKGSKKHSIELVHKNFETLLKIAEQRIPAFVVGPAGSGKTKAAEQVAVALALEFSSISVGPQTTQSQIMGYMNATGKYVKTEFRERFEKGGVYLIDEFDSGSAQVLTCLNSALAGDLCAFPDGMIKKHEDFIPIASGNTFGNGADRIYVGRAQLDGATLDRFAFLEWEYDEALELQVSGAIPEWHRTVLSFRKRAEEKGMRHIVSPRATIYGQKLIEGGMHPEEVKKLLIFKGLSRADIERLDV